VREIDVSFLGSATSYRSVRIEYIEYANSQRLQIFHSGGTGGIRLTMMEYADILRRSKISINISFSVEKKHQLKARVFEIVLCGALLFESSNP
jgi:hypothetical protein